MNQNFELFITEISKIQDNIEKSQDQYDLLQDSKIRNKQYLFYYLYRIICKYRKELERTDVSEIINNLYDIINVKDNSNINKCFPLINKLTNDEKILDQILLASLSIFFKYSQEVDKLTKTPQSKNFEDFIMSKVYEDDIIVNDLIKLSLLLPNLSRPRTLTEMEMIKNKNEEELLKSFDI
jgi:hypothetical protein